MDDGRPTEVPPLGDADVWEDDDFTRALCEEAPRTYGAGLFSIISLSILLVMGVDASDLRKLVEPPSAAEQTVAKGLVEAAFTCINNEDVNSAFRSTLSGTSIGVSQRRRVQIYHCLVCSHRSSTRASGRRNII